MKISVSRLEGFSDALIAIVMTLMVLEIPLPSIINLDTMFGFLKSILIYFASFIIVGSQWNRHHKMLDDIEYVSNSFVWKNIIWLFTLSLIPLFMKWVLIYPKSVIPALLYAFIYLLNDFIMRVLFINILKEKNGSLFIRKFKRDRNKTDIKRLLLMVFYIVLVFSIAAVISEASIVLFIILPVIMSLSNIFKDENEFPLSRERILLK